MKSWTDIGLIVAIVIGLISAASLPMVSVNAVSPESLRMHAATDEPSPWALVSQGTIDTSWKPLPTQAVGAARAQLIALEPRQAKALGGN